VLFCGESSRKFRCFQVRAWKRLAAASSFGKSLLSVVIAWSSHQHHPDLRVFQYDQPSGPEAVEKTVKMAYFFSTPVDIDIVLDDGDDRQMVDMKTEKGRREKAPLYKDGESVKGAVTIRPKDGKRLEHTGIKVQFIGTIGRPQCRLPEYINSLVPQKCSSIVETITNSCLWAKN
jgi:hypothetical protein